MKTNCPKPIQEVLDDLIRHLWDQNFPKPNLDSLSEWLEVDGWDDVVDGLHASYVYCDALAEFFNDRVLMDYVDLRDLESITDADRLTYARNRVEFLTQESMDSLHIIEIDSETLPPAVLGVMLYYHGQAGEASFHEIKAAFTPEDYIKSKKGVLVMGNDDLSDEEILQMWEHPNRRTKRKSR